MKELRKGLAFWWKKERRQKRKAFFYEGGCHLGSRVRSERRKKSDPREKKGKEKKRKERKKEKQSLYFHFLFHIFGPSTLVIKLEEDVNFHPFCIC